MKAKRLRWTLLMFATALLLVATSFGPAFLARLLAPVDLLLIVASLVLGYRYLTRKRAIDDAFLDDLIAGHMRREREQ